MTKSGLDPVLADGEFAADRQSLAVAGGDCLIYSRPAPDRVTPNEDTVAVIPIGPEAAVFVIADGAGGLPAGRRASQTAVQTLAAGLEPAQAGTTLLRTAVLNGIECANRAVQALGNGSATTLTVIAIDGLEARAYQIGDSEAMVVGQRGRLKLQTPVHSPTGFAVEAGLLDQRDALHHADRHLVSNFLGTPNMRIDVGAGIRLRPHDTVLLASDGLTDNLHLEEIIELIRCGPLQKALDGTIDLAGARMTRAEAGQPSKPDDLSLILFRKPYRLHRSSPG